ncbi:MAG TPA: helix-turn-helix domain-containing protein [Rhizomicrobium sp.]|jgi:AraC-like DNA-binding protein
MIPHVHFDAGNYAPERAFEVWKQTMIVTHDVARLDDRPFTGTADGWLLDDLYVTQSLLPPLRMTRGEAKIRLHNGGAYNFMYVAEGEGTCAFDGGRERPFPAGTVAVLDMTRPYSAGGHMVRTVSIGVPRHQLIAAMRGELNIHGVMLDGPLGRLVGDHISSVVALAPQTPVSEAPVFARTTVQLLAASVASRAKTKDEPLYSFAIRHDIVRYVDKHLNQPDLDPEMICAALGLSRAAAYRAFRGSDGIASLIRGRRLQAARTMLKNPGERRPVAEIASAVGYSDPALFSRVYHRTFDETPRESRAAPLSPIERGNPTNFRDWLRELEIHFARNKQA